MPISTTSVSQAGVSVTASQTDGMLSAFTVRIAEAGLAFTACGDAGSWHLKLPGTEVKGAPFEAVWDALPQAVRARPGRPWIAVKATVAELIDRHGRVTAPGLGYSTRRASVETRYAAVVDCYGSDCGVAVLREIARAQGYKVVPDLKLMAAHPGCHAYHEVVGGIYDDMVEDGAPDLARVLRASDRLDSFHDQLNEVSAGREPQARPEEVSA